MEVSHETDDAHPLDPRLVDDDRIRGHVVSRHWRRHRSRVATRRGRQRAGDAHVRQLQRSRSLHADGRRTWFQSTGSDGRFDIGVTFPAQPNAYAKNQKLVVDLFGSETSVFSKRTVAWNADPAFWTVDIVIRNAPANVSPDGGYWARKIGCGEYPVFVVEGFDPGDSMKTGDKADPTSWVGLLSASQLPNGGGGLLDYFTSHNYSVYLLSSGFNSANSIKADTSGDVTKGMAYQSVFLAKTILEQSHPGKPLVMGGYSAGGLTARAGLTKWCDGSYAGVSGGFLDAGCSAVTMWFSGDAPQKGAKGPPISLQRYVHDDEVIGDLTGVEVVQQMLDAPAAQEMLQQSIGPQLCNTNCSMDFWVARSIRSAASRRTTTSWTSAPCTRTSTTISCHGSAATRRAQVAAESPRSRSRSEPHGVTRPARFPSRRTAGTPRPDAARSTSRPRSSVTAITTSTSTRPAA